MKQPINPYPLKSLHLLLLTLSLIFLGLACNEVKTPVFRIVESEPGIEFTGNAKVYPDLLMSLDTLKGHKFITGDGDFFFLDEQIIYLDFASVDMLKSNTQEPADFDKIPLLYLDLGDFEIQKQETDSASFPDLTGFLSITFDSIINDELVNRLANTQGLKGIKGLDLQKTIQGKEKITRLFDPQWLVIDIRTEKDHAFIEGFQNLEALCLTGIDSSINRPLPRLPNLKSILLSIDDYTYLPDHYLINNRHVTRMVTFEKIPGLFEELSEFPELRSLVLRDESDTLDLVFLRNLIKLEELSLPMEEKEQVLLHMEEIGKLAGLKWLVLPASVDSAMVHAITDGLNQLQVLELMSGRDMDNLLSIPSIKNLEALLIRDTLEDPAGITALNQLDFLSLPVEVLEDSVYSHELATALPDTHITPNQGLCLGSGWLLLFAPALLLLILLRKRINKSE